jgi:hypothetical protein
MEKVKPVVELAGKDGNAFAILGCVRRVLKEAGYTPTEIEEFSKQAMSGDYDHLLRVCMQWATIK